MAQTTHVSNKFAWSQRCLSHWGLTVLCFNVVILDLEGEAGETEEKKEEGEGEATTEGEGQKADVEGEEGEKKEEEGEQKEGEQKEEVQKAEGEEGEEVSKSPVPQVNMKMMWTRREEKSKFTEIGSPVNLVWFEQWPSNF